MRGRKLFDIQKNGVLAGHVLERNHVVQRKRVEAAAHGRVQEQGLDFRGEEKAALGASIVQGFLAHAVAGHKQAPAGRIPHGQRVHAAQLAHEVLAIGFVGMGDDLGVGVGLECVAAALQVAAQTLEIIDFSVEHGPD